MSTTLRPGDAGEDVRRWQGFLNERGYGPLAVDGVFGEATTAATTRYQLAHGLTSGVLDAQTRAVAVAEGMRFTDDEEPTDPGIGLWHAPGRVGASRVNAPGVTFGPTFTRVLGTSAAMCGGTPRTVLTVLAFESGLDPWVENVQGARGLWQRLPLKGEGGKLTRYAERDPARQLADALAFWRAMRSMFHVRGNLTLQQFYCLNLAPARLAGDVSNDATVVYHSKLHPADYKANAGLDADHKGFITIADLLPALMRAAREYAPRIERELSALGQGAA